MNRGPGSAPPGLELTALQRYDKQQQNHEILLARLEAIEARLGGVERHFADRSSAGAGESTERSAILPPVFGATSPGARERVDGQWPAEPRAGQGKSRDGMDGAIEAFCRGLIEDRQLIDEARRLSLRWGSAMVRDAQRRVGVSFDSAENRILVFQKHSGSSEFFLVLRGDAHWSFDLELLFDGHAPGGGPAEHSIYTLVRTLRPSVGRLDGNDLVVSSVGEVEVGTR